MNLIRLACLTLVLSSAYGKSLSLDGGHWSFALDPAQRGEQLGWPRVQSTGDGKGIPGWDSVTVPHCWSNDPRYEHTGKAWYVRQFRLPAEWTDPFIRLGFSSIGDRCRVWLNGQFLGAHDGVNLPFSFDATPLIDRGNVNVLAIEVDNSFSDTTIPGSRPGNAPSSQVYPWWNYGGILGHVALESEPGVHVVAFKTQIQFLREGSVRLEFHARIENRGQTDALTLSAKVQVPRGSSAPLEKTVSLSIPVGTTVDHRLDIEIPAALVDRWDLDHPALYACTVSVASREGSHALTHRIGLREISISAGRLMLNGEPVHLAGANHARGHPLYGGLEPAAFVEQEMTLMKRGHLEFSRLEHFPIGQEMLDWADEHGMLIIAEAGNWQFAPSQLSSPAMRSLWQKHMRELIESAWDRPSVIGWSVGNEYNSWSSEGMAWTKDMTEWVRALDGTRLVTFAAVHREFASKVENISERAFQYVDLICGNYYGPAEGIAPVLDFVHRLFPDKPIMISEFGMRADQAKQESDRVAHYSKVLDIVRQRPFVCGLSYWSFNDYRSRYPDTTPNGFRAWGLVDQDRNPRGLYDFLKSELSPAIVTTKPSGDKTMVTVTARADFPARELRDFRLRVVSGDGQEISSTNLPALSPGKRFDQSIPSIPPGSKFELIRPSGFIDAPVDAKN